MIGDIISCEHDPVLLSILGCMAVWLYDCCLQGAGLLSLQPTAPSLQIYSNSNLPKTPRLKMPFEAAEWLPAMHGWTTMRYIQGSLPVDARA